MGKFDEELKKVKNASIKKVCAYLKTREDIKLNLEKENKSIDEVGTLKSESMYIEDCYVKVRAYNVEEIMKPSYVIINEG